MAAEKKSGFDTFAVTCMALAAVAFVYALSLFLQGGFLAARGLEHERKVLAPDNTELRDARAAQQAVLDEGYRWIDRDSGKVGIPVERAVELIVERDGRLTPAAGQ